MEEFDIYNTVLQIKTIIENRKKQFFRKQKQIFGVDKKRILGLQML